MSLGIYLKLILRPVNEEIKNDLKLVKAESVNTVQIFNKKDDGGVGGFKFNENHNKDKQTR